jgi:hypothetical protein
MLQPNEDNCLQNISTNQEYKLPNFPKYSSPTMR